ncbi:MAG: hypothetical protein AAF715_16135 [Myxococcota bacterium]
MRSMLSSGCVFLAVSALAGCASSPATGGAVVPLKRVRLYETGVGYFERSGAIPGDTAASLPVPAGHVDDALKSLVVLGGDQGVGRVVFDSRQRPAIARARAGLPADPDADIGFDVLLESLVGERVTLRTGARSVTGRLVGRVTEALLTEDRPNPAPRPHDDDEPDDDDEGVTASEVRNLAVVRTEGGGFTRLEVARLTAVLPLDQVVRDRFDQALRAEAARSGASARRLDVFSKGGADVTLGYLAETPVWRTSYRLVFGDDGKPQLSAWALVHNDTEEPWRGVQVELANGRPDSFLFPLAAPRYERRPLATPPRELSSVPQLLGTTPDGMWGDFTAGDEYGSGGLGLSGYGSGHGGGFARGRAGRHRRGQAGATSSDLLRLGDLARVDEAKGREAPTVFVYRGSTLLDLAPQRSALVPFLQRPVEADIISWFDGFSRVTGRFAVRFVNSGDTTLPPGPVSVFADGGFAGETMLDRLAPGERRHAPIAEDLDIRLERTSDRSSREPKRLVFRQGRFEEHYLQRRAITFTLSNRSGRAREVLIQLDAGRNAKVEGAPRITFDRERNRPLAGFDLPAGARDVGHSLVVVEGLHEVASPDALDVARLETLAQTMTLSDRNRKVAAAVAAERRRVQTADEALEKKKAEITQVEADIARLRGHLEAVKGETPATENPVLMRLLATEDRLTALRAERDELAASLTAAKRDVEAALAPLRPATET